VRPGILSGDSRATAQRTMQELRGSRSRAGVTGRLGPANLERNGDGSIVIDGDKVDNPEDYKAEPLGGGPSDPNATS
jgi:hypothetical protein